MLKSTRSQSFHDQATQRRTSYQNWVARIKPILKMFSQTERVMSANSIIPYHYPECVENQALFMLISAKVDHYYRNLISRVEGFGDRDLHMLQDNCANITAMDTHDLHQFFMALRICLDETATKFIHRFVMARTQAALAGDHSPMNKWQTLSLQASTSITAVDTTKLQRSF